MKVIVHHGGVGTTAAALRAGVPSIIVPFTADQPFWGRKVHQLGVGPKPIPQKKLTVKGLAEAIRTAATNPTMRERVARLGGLLRTEDGVARAVGIVERYLGVTGKQGCSEPGSTPSTCSQCATAERHGQTE
jgi:UDP:flavonoid glycosyltransferase YjiC (YdhE family)